MSWWKVLVLAAAISVGLVLHGLGGRRREAMKEEPTISAHILRLKTTAALPPSDPLSVPLLRLMAATNDVRQLQKLVLVTRDPNDPASPKPPQAAYFVQSGELLYFIRLLFGHLYEAGIIFRGIDQDHAATVTKLVAATKRGKQALLQVREVFGDTSNAGFYKAVLGPVRTLAAFHYKDATFREGLQKLVKDTKDTALVLAEWAGFSRYAITDLVLEGRVVEAAGGTREALDAALGRAIALADALDTVVGELARLILESRPAGAAELGPAETMSIPSILHAEARKRARLLA